VLKDILAAIRCGEPFSQAIGASRSSSRRSYSRPSRRASAPATCASARPYIGLPGGIDRVRKKIISATIYPAILMTSACCVSFLMFYVVPRFARVTKIWPVPCLSSHRLLPQFRQLRK